MYTLFLKMYTLLEMYTLFYKMYTLFVYTNDLLFHALTSLFTTSSFYYLPSFLEMYTMYTLFFDLGLSEIILVFVYCVLCFFKKHPYTPKKSVYIVYISKKLGK